MEQSMASGKSPPDGLAMQQMSLCQKLMDTLVMFRDEQSISNNTLRLGNTKNVTLMQSQQHALDKLSDKINELEMQQNAVRDELRHYVRWSAPVHRVSPDSADMLNCSPENSQSKLRAVSSMAPPHHSREGSEKVDSSMMRKPSQPVLLQTSPDCRTAFPDRECALKDGFSILESPQQSPELAVKANSLVESHVPSLSEEEAQRRDFKDSVEKAMKAVAQDELSESIVRATRDDVRNEVSKHIEVAHLEEQKGAVPKKVNYVGAHLFPDADELKAHIRHSVLHPYDVNQLYHEKGWAQFIACSEYFEITTMCVIAINSVWMSIDIDINGSQKAKEKHLIFQIAEWMFFVYFFFEWSVRFLAFQSKCAGLRDQWFAFDSVLIILMTLDTFMPMIFGDAWGSKTSILRVVRLVKMVRMARVAKLLNYFPELLVLVKAIAIAARSVLSTIVLMMCITYVFAVMFRYLTVDTHLEDIYFNSVLHAMKSLLLEVCLPDGMVMVNKLGGESLLYGILGTLFIIAAAVTLLNMLIAVLCEVIGVVSQVEKESLRVTFVRDKLRDVLLAYDENHDMLMSESEFHQLLLDPNALKVLRDTGVDPLGLVDFTEYIFCGDFNDVSKDGITFDKFVDMILRLGGSNTATVKDVVDLRKMIYTKLELIEHAIIDHQKAADPERSRFNTNDFSFGRSL